MTNDKLGNTSFSDNEFLIINYIFILDVCLFTFKKLINGYKCYYTSEVIKYLIVL
jgi:hypothetical protein